MKKLKLFILMSIAFVFGLSNVNAMSLKPTGSGAGKRGSETTIYITLNKTSSEKEVSALDGKFSFDSDVFELVSADSMMGNNWSQLSGVSNNSSFAYANLQYNDLITSTSKNIVKVVLKVKSDAKYGDSTISVNNPSATDEVGDEVSISGGSLTFKVLSDVNTLSNLSIDGADIDFNENTITYNLEIDSDKTTISATKKDSGSQLSGDMGDKALKYGKNTFKVNVTSESGVVKTYTINITRPDNRSNVNTLASLELSEGKIKFNKDTLNYSVTVGNKVTSIKLDATLTDEKSSFVSGYGPRTVVLKVGTNVIELRVKAENEEVKTYKITVTRKDDGSKNDNNYLSELTLSNGTLNFNKENLEYKVIVLNNVETVTVTAKAEYAKATVEVDMPEKLAVGENVITVTVKAENGTTREYKVVVERKADNTELSSNIEILEFTIEGYEFYFNNNTYDYDLKIKDENSLVINYILDDPKSKITIDGNNDLKNGSVITVTVTAEDGTSATYKINVQKDETNYALIYGGIALLVVLLLIIIVLILVMSKSKKKNKTADNQTNPTVNSAPYPRPQNIQNMTYSQDIPIVQNPQVQSMQNVQNNQVSNSDAVSQQNNNNNQ